MSNPREALEGLLSYAQDSGSGGCEPQALIDHLTATGCDFDRAIDACNRAIETGLIALTSEGMVVTVAALRAKEAGNG